MTPRSANTRRTAEILRSQRRRLFIQRVTADAGAPLDWSFKARFDDDARYVRGAKASEIKARKRFPYLKLTSTLACRVWPAASN